MAETRATAASLAVRTADLVVVDICQLVISRDPGKVLVTYALGSCVSICLHDPQAMVAGMIHYMLPESRIDPARAQAKPGMFGDSGLPRLFQDFYAAGGKKNRLSCFLVGGASTLDSEGHFNIGKRNIMLARKLFWKNGITVKREDSGGSDSRTVYLEVATGRVVIRRPGGKEKELWA